MMLWAYEVLMLREVAMPSTSELMGVWGYVEKDAPSLAQLPNITGTWAVLPFLLTRSSSSVFT